MAISVELKQARRDHILDTARKLIGRRDVSGFSMAELAEHAGVSPATPYNLVGSKPEILNALIRFEVKDFASSLEARQIPANLDGLGKNLRLDADGRYRWHWDPRFLDPETGINAGAVALMTECYEAIPRLHLPILLVRGMQSELVNEDSAKSFVERAPDATYVDIRDAGHMVAGDRNDVFSEEVTRFLKDQLLGD